LAEPESPAPAPPPAAAKEAGDKIKTLEEQVTDAVKSCYDPEIPVNIWELGLVYSLAVSPENDVEVKMTLTAPACPVAGTLPGEVEAKVKAVPGVRNAKVELVWEPAWTPDKMSKLARVMLGM